MGVSQELSRYSLLHCVALEVDKQMRLGLPVTDGVREAMERLGWRDWAEEEAGPASDPEPHP